MEFLHKTEKGEVIKLPVRVVRAETHQDIYANGASGGPLANYHFRIDFYKDEFPPRDFIVVDKQIKDETVVEIERKVLASVYVSMPFLKELKNWLNKQVDAIEVQYGEIALPKSEEESEDSEVETLPTAKEA